MLGVDQFPQLAIEKEVPMYSSVETSGPPSTHAKGDLVVAEAPHWLSRILLLEAVQLVPPLHIFYSASVITTLFK
jgi:hypothetical protein